MNWRVWGNSTLPHARFLSFIFGIIERDVSLNMSTSLLGHRIMRWDGECNCRPPSATTRTRQPPSQYYSMAFQRAPCRLSAFGLIRLVPLCKIGPTPPYSRAWALSRSMGRPGQLNCSSPFYIGGELPHAVTSSRRKKRKCNKLNEKCNDQLLHTFPVPNAGCRFSTTFHLIHYITQLRLLPPIAAISQPQQLSQRRPGPSFVYRSPLRAHTPQCTTRRRYTGLRSIMSFQNYPQPFSPQNDASICPTEGAGLPTSLPPGAHTLEGHPSIQDLLFTHPTPWSPADQTWMQPMGAGSSPLMQDQASNPYNGMIPLWPARVMAIHGNHHPAWVPLGMNTVQHR